MIEKIAHLHDEGGEEEDHKVLGDGEAVNHRDLIGKERSYQLSIIIPIPWPPSQEIHIDITKATIGHPVAPVNGVPCTWLL